MLKSNLVLSSTVVFMGLVSGVFADEQAQMPHETPVCPGTKLSEIFDANIFHYKMGSAYLYTASSFVEKSPKILKDTSTTAPSTWEVDMKSDRKALLGSVIPMFDRVSCFVTARAVDLEDDRVVGDKYRDAYQFRISAHPKKVAVEIWFHPNWELGLKSLHCTYDVSSGVDTQDMTLGSFVQGISTLSFETGSPILNVPMADTESELNQCKGIKEVKLSRENDTVQTASEESSVRDGS